MKSFIEKSRRKIKLTALAVLLLILCDVAIYFVFKNISFKNEYLTKLFDCFNFTVLFSMLFIWIPMKHFNRMITIYVFILFPFLISQVYLDLNYAIYIILLFLFITALIIFGNTILQTLFVLFVYLFIVLLVQQIGHIIGLDKSLQVLISFFIFAIIIKIVLRYMLKLFKEVFMIGNTSDEAIKNIVKFNYLFYSIIMFLFYDENINYITNFAFLVCYLIIDIEWLKLSNFN